MSTTRLRTPIARRRPAGPPRRRLYRLALLVGLFFLALLAAWLILHRQTRVVAHHAVPVTVAKATLANMPIEVRSIGNTTPINSVSVKAHVAGQIISTHFREGQVVHAGQLLFTIDPRAAMAALSGAQADVLNKRALVDQASAAITKDQAALVQAQANKTRDIATANNAVVEARRYAGLAGQGAVSLEQYQQYRTTAISAEATVRADQAVIGNVQAMIKADRANLLAAKAQLAQSLANEQNARVQLSYTNVTAPISGLAGNLQVLNGNIVQADNQTLVTVNQIDPIDVSLTVPEQEFAQVRRYAAGGAVGATAYGPTGGLLAANGRLVFENNRVDPATGTVLLKARFANADQKLWPGQFVNVVLTLTVVPNAVVVPSRSVQLGQNGSFVWVVRPDRTVHMQPVVPGASYNGLTMIERGLAPGADVVTDGQLQLSEGTTVSLSPMKGL